MNRRKAGKKLWLISVAAGAAIALIYLRSQNGFSAPDSQTFWHILCDALFIPGILLTGLGLLVFAANGGTFDMLHYGIQKALRLVLSKEKRDRYPKTFFDYRYAKNGKPPAPTAFLLVPGLLYLLGATIALILYMSNS